jgi:hypothetical protein
MPRRSLIPVPCQRETCALGARVVPAARRDQDNLVPSPAAGGRRPFFIGNVVVHFMRRSVMRL